MKKNNKIHLFIKESEVFGLKNEKNSSVGEINIKDPVKKYCKNG